MEETGAQAGGLGQEIAASMGAAIQAFAAGFPIFAAHTGVTVAILLVATMLYGLITPHRELKLMRDGNTAAAISFGGVVVALAMPLASAMRWSVSWAEIALWGVVVVLVQLLALRVVDFLVPGVSRRIAAGESAAAIFLVSVKIAVSIILTAAVAGEALVPRA